METKKQEAIRLAWKGKINDLIDIDQNGWVKCYVWKKDLKDDFEYSEIREENEKYFATAFKHRPKSLQGIEDNNGWVFLTEKRPQEGEFCFVIMNGYISIKQYHLIQYAWWDMYVTHYQSIINPKPPIF